MILLAVLAQAATDYGPLAQFGVLGIVLAWFMLRAEKLMTTGASAMNGELAKLANRIDALTKAMLMDLVSRDNVGHHTKSQASIELAKLDDRK